MGIESYHSPPGLQPECRTLPRLQWESSSPPDSGGNTRGRVKYRKDNSHYILCRFHQNVKFRDQSGGIPGLKPDSGQNTRGRVKTSESLAIDQLEFCVQDLIQ